MIMHRALIDAIAKVETKHDEHHNQILEAISLQRYNDTQSIADSDRSEQTCCNSSPPEYSHLDDDSSVLSFNTVVDDENISKSHRYDQIIIDDSESYVSPTGRSQHKRNRSNERVIHHQYTQSQHQDETCKSKSPPITSPTRKTSFFPTFLSWTTGQDQSHNNKEQI